MTNPVHEAYARALLAKNSNDLPSTLPHDLPIIDYVNAILQHAVEKKASDIHFEPYETYYRIRYRLDGLLQEIATPPLSIANRITARLKIMADLDISERRLPQDGRFQIPLKEQHPIDVRISTCPVAGGEKMVLRLLNTVDLYKDIHTLGFTENQHQLFLAALQKPQGIILVTGPTGSGKTITLYSALHYLNTDEKNIISIEDPIEIKMSGINQVNIQHKNGLSFANCLRALLRQDPDVMMIGEIRDAETAEIAINASQTGHLVLSTLHTNSAVESIIRLMNLGVATFNIASSIHLIIAQRLVRCICKQCWPDAATDTAMTLHEPSPHYFSKSIPGCEHCRNGYKGRSGLFEVLPISKTIAESIIAGASSMDILQLAKREGLKTLYDVGLEKVKKGITSTHEIHRVTQYA